MRNWFPFTDYDFYGYLASGFTLLFVLDFVITGGNLMIRETWTFVEIVLVVSLAYAAGQIAAVPSSIILEHWLTKKVLYPPVSILIGVVTPRRRERFAARFFVGRYYEPLSQSVRQSILARAADATGKPADRLMTDPEDIFQPAYTVARTVPDARERMDHFRNQYGLNRNMALVALVAAPMLAIRAGMLDDDASWLWAGLAAVFGMGLFARFLKFYCAFAAEVLRTFAFMKREGQKDGD